ncbi:MAG: CBS domain-containing protein [Firmicutes bacterium]|nr:CBS domain-containing protein [Bacillota bacterium]
MGTNGTRFVNAYNVIDHGLRTIYNFKANVTFTDLIRRCASLNTVVRIYEDDLVDLARLRNAIIHNKTETLVAEPNIEVVELFEKIAKLVMTPPTAIERLTSKDVATIPSHLSLKELIIEAARLGYGSIPVYKNNVLIGVWRKYRFVEVMGSHIIPRGESIDDFIENMTGEDFLRTFPTTNRYLLAGQKITIEEVLTAFTNNRKLACILITEDGTANCRPLGIVTRGDLINLMQVLEDY